MLTMTTTVDFAGRSLFGYASRCASIEEVTALLREMVDDDARAATAAYGMLLAVNLAHPGPYREDALKALDLLVHTKAALDIAASHLRPIVDVTAEILLTTQRYADEATVPCTEWPTVSDLAEIVLHEAKKFAKVKRWARYKKDERGNVAGIQIVHGGEE